MGHGTLGWEGMSTHQAVEVPGLLAILAMAMLWRPQKELSHRGVGAEGISACRKREFCAGTPVLTPGLTGTGPTPCCCSRSGCDPLFLLPESAGSRRGSCRLGSA